MDVRRLHDPIQRTEVNVEALRLHTLEAKALAVELILTALLEGSGQADAIIAAIEQYVDHWGRRTTTAAQSGLAELARAQVGLILQNVRQSAPRPQAH